ncbi:signal peptidase II [Deinobacterium chartae]|uniref:Lipoprotein signal peptidase n=1 Tax=Deinobacterium chartae TaxID=521158 RepID=A0A841I7E2_9DEIO|nr:signal peptidase II [Deinobacterium chartae]MBB6099735.1 signal peptidase II [Deinobacterium chartae]
MIVLGVVLDQLLKVWAVSTFQEGEFRAFVGGFLSLGLIYNKGAAWGMLGGLTVVLAVVRICVGLWITFSLLRGKYGDIYFPLSLIAAGALGNALDGFRLGKVVDPLMSHTLSNITQFLYGQDFPIFNLADVFVVSGVILVVLRSFLQPSKAKHPSPLP